MQDKDAGLISSLQKAVNTARRTEGKVKRLAAEKLEKQNQWASWEAELRKTFSREKARHTAALQKLDGDMQEALKQQAEARETVRQVAVGGVPSEKAEPRVLLNEEFDAVVNATVSDPWELETSQDAVLQRALAATMAAPGVATSGSASAGGLNTPPRATGVVPMTPGPGTAAATQRMVRAPLPRTNSTSRMTPFPPPMEVQGGGLPMAEQLGAGPTLKEPYTTPLNHKGKDIAKAPVLGLGQSPNWQPTEDASGCEGV